MLELDPESTRIDQNGRLRRKVQKPIFQLAQDKNEKKQFETKHFNFGLKTKKLLFVKEEDVYKKIKLEPFEEERTRESIKLEYQDKFDHLPEIEPYFEDLSEIGMNMLFFYL